MRKIVGGAVLLIIIGVAGIMFLVRGCLSKYDERSALTPSLYFEKNSKAVLFSIVNFEKATSYSQNGGFISKTVNVTYFIQNNDPVTTEKLKDREVKSLEDMKRQPVEILGKADGKAFVYMGELMAFDPFTLETVVNETILERINPSLRGSFPADRKYYVFQPTDSSILITMKNGSPWKLNTKTLQLTATEEKTDDTDAAVTAIEQQLETIRMASQNLMTNQLRPLSDLLAKKEITLTEYNRRVQDFLRKRNLLRATEDSLGKMISLVENAARKKAELIRTVANLQNNHNSYFAQAKLNMDTLKGTWFGIYTKEEVTAFGERFQDQPSYADPARRIFYTGKYEFKSDGELRIDRTATTNVSGSFFLNGGFLLDKLTGRPIHLSDASFLVISKDQVGNDGKIIVNRVNGNGKVMWNLNSDLKEWSHWIVAANRLIILGTNNKELSTGNINLLLSVDLDTGLANRYDFFKDK
jgi:hypothetical protein